jgi:hypothetical protein
VFVVCIDDTSSPASLIVGKVHQKLPDRKGDEPNLLRIVDDDTSETYGNLYPASMFVLLQLPLAAEQALGSIKVGTRSVG